MVNLVDHLHRRRRQPGVRQCGDRRFGKQPAGTRMQRMRLADDGIACGDGRREIATSDAGERVWENCSEPNTTTGPIGSKHDRI
jgi:hypothetical protein